MSNVNVVWLENPSTGDFINPTLIDRVSTVQDPVTNEYRYNFSVNGALAYQSSAQFATSADAVNAIAAIFNEVLLNTSTTVTSVTLT